MDLCLFQPTEVNGYALSGKHLFFRPVVRLQGTNGGPKTAGSISTSSPVESVPDIWVPVTTVPCPFRVKYPVHGQTKQSVNGRWVTCRANCLSVSRS